MQIKNIRSFVDGIIILLIGFIYLYGFISKYESGNLLQWGAAVISLGYIGIGRYKILKSFIK